MEKGGQISGGGGAGGGWDSIFENDQSGKVNNIELGIRLFQLSNEITGANWPDVTAVRSPCPTLNVIGAISKQMIEKEELKRMVERPGLNADGTAIKLTKRKKAKVVAQKVVGGVLSNTVGRVGRFASRRLLGKVPETAIEGSFQEPKPETENKLLQKSEIHSTVSKTSIEDEADTQYDQQELKDIEKDQQILQMEISNKIFVEQESSDEAKEAKSSVGDMKSDSELFNEIMQEKERIPDKSTA